LSKDPLRWVVTPAETGEVDPGEVSGIRHPIARDRKMLREQICHQSSVLIQGDQKTVEPRVALYRERGDGGEHPELAGPPLDFDRQRPQNSSGVVRGCHHERALEAGEIERLARTDDGE